jgi:hypothetical protein|tara:strand:+ start:223 stop:414 length:192 start_codon:yes stop_codon:yes gene_type:complete
MENENRIYQASVKDAYETVDKGAETELNPREKLEFSPAYEELNPDFSSNPFSARSCRCHPSRC